MLMRKGGVWERDLCSFNNKDITSIRQEKITGGDEVSYAFPRVREVCQREMMSKLQDLHNAE